MSRGHSPCECESVQDQLYEDGTERLTREYYCYFLLYIDHFRKSCGQALVVDWTPRCCYVLELKVFLEFSDAWLLFWGRCLFRGEPQTQIPGRGRRFKFQVKTDFPSLPLYIPPVL